MILKRRERKPVQKGSFCILKDDVKIKLKENANYTKKSVSHKAWCSDRKIHDRHLRSYGRPNSHCGEVMIADAKLLFVLNNTVFRDVFLVAILSVDQDSSNCSAVRKLFSIKKYMYIKKDCLLQVGVDQAQSIAYPQYNSISLNFISQHINDYVEKDSNYEKSFSWAGK